MMPFLVSRARIWPDTENAVAAYAMELRNGVVPDLSGGGFDAAVNGSPMAIRHILGSGLQFDGVADYLDSGNVGTIKSACFWMSPDTTTEDIADFDSGTHTIEITAGTLTATGFASPALYVNGAAGSSVVADAYQLIGVSTATGFSATALQWGLLTGKIIGMFRVSNIEESATWFAGQYALGRRALWKTNPVNNTGNVTSGFIGDSPFKIDATGAFKATDGTLDGENVTVIECVTAGRFTVPTSLFQQSQSESAHGGWKFKWNKADASNFVFQIIAQSAGTFTAVNGYSFIHRASEVVDLLKGAAVILDGGATVYAHSTWHTCEVARTPDEEFSLDVNSANIGSVTDSTYVTSSNVTIEMGVGDKVSLGAQSGNHSIIKRLTP